MTFYNPFFPPFLNFPRPNFTNNSQVVDNTLKLPESTSEKRSSPLPFLQNIFQDTDTLIILALLFFLYNQENRSLPLMLCLFLLLFD